MKRLFYLSIFCLFALGVYAQSYNTEKMAFTNFIIRMYENAPFEGARIVKDYENAYLISVIALDKNQYKTEAILNRVASVKAMAEASRFLNGSTISQETIICTSQTGKGDIDAKWIETIRENSMGHMQSLEQLTNFTREDGMQVYIYYKQIESKKRKRR